MTLTDGVVGVFGTGQAVGYELVPGRLIKDAARIIGLDGPEVGVGSGSATSAIMFVTASPAVAVTVEPIPQIIPIRRVAKQFQQGFPADIAKGSIGHINARRNIAVGLQANIGSTGPATAKVLGHHPSSPTAATTTMAS